MLASSSVYILVRPTSYAIACGILHRYEQKEEIVSTSDRTPGIEAAPCRCTYCIYIRSNKLKTHMRGLAHTYSALPPFPFVTWIKDVVLAAQWCYHSKLPWPRPFQHPGPTDLGLEQRPTQSGFLCSGRDFEKCFGFELGLNESPELIETQLGPLFFWGFSAQFTVLTLNDTVTSKHIGLSYALLVLCTPTSICVC